MKNLNISAGTIARTLVLIFALINQILTYTGKNPLPFSEDEAYSAITSALTVTASIMAWWKNNSFTAEAIQADEVMRKLKDGK